MVSALDPGSKTPGLIPGRGHCVVFLNKTYELLSKREVKMAGYWPISIFACLWTETESRSINSQK